MNYWIGVASKDHVALGVAGGFCQLCHGKSAPLNKMKAGDWLIYYAPKQSLKIKEPCQEFIALGQVLPGETYSFEMAPGFVPFRKNIDFLKKIQPVPLQAVAQFRLWQEYRSRLRFGHFQIPEELFDFIVSGMKRA
ncbi:hypothetical protein ATZ33_02865 [Enterococcus silesiacus]|uniref:UPF0310 protein ATZ33_02865 n=1 Tax=Enterococcus silesiacus TaxID=332949 RepID=A0A0S3K7X2_9ENTE|nr:EVE domain-containing protein [Enterococcus silesiacus]ALS00356.1 hypothetical protein ATZ33_02865 [Enterococcus silesiacus]OJG93348.1 hypothetical protein RV15_GL001380 [Enterococcus silesiacus]